MKLVVAILIILILIGIPAGLLFLLSSHSSLAFAQQPKANGLTTPIIVHVTNPHGTRHVLAAIEQNGATQTLAESASPANRFNFWRSHLPPQDFHFIAGKKQAPNLKEGKARLVVALQSNDLAGSTDTISADVEVILKPASVTADGFQHYINQGGSEMVMFTPSGSWTEAGVRLGSNTFRSFPVPGNASQRFALFVFPW